MSKELRGLTVKLVVERHDYDGAARPGEQHQFTARSVPLPVHQLLSAHSDIRAQLDRAMKDATRVLTGAHSTSPEIRASAKADAEALLTIYQWIGDLTDLEPF